MLGLTLTLLLLLISDHAGKRSRTNWLMAAGRLPVRVKLVLARTMFGMYIVPRIWIFFFRVVNKSGREYVEV